MRYLPIELDIAGRDALVVGAGPEGAAKAARLVAAGARVTVIATGAVEAPLREDARAGRLRLEERSIEDGDLERASIVFAEPGDEALSRRLLAWGRRTGLPVCTLDRPELSTFVNPAVVDVEGLTIAFGSGGASPGTLRRIREDLSAIFGDERLGRWLVTIKAWREKFPRGERAGRLEAAMRGFGLEGKLRFPVWFERGADPPGD